MNNSIKLLKKYKTEPTIGRTVEINEKLCLFSLRHYKSDITQEKLFFLKELKQITNEGFKMDENGSGVYHFKRDNSIIELDISIDDSIDIKPYIIYQEKNVKEDIDDLMKLDYLIFSILKSNDLQ